MSSCGGILLTGRNGFVGGHLLRAFRDVGSRLITFDRCRSPHRDLISENVISYFGNLDVEADLAEIHEPVNVVIHAAARVPADNVSVSEYIRDNITAVQNLVSFAETSNCKTFVYLSTISINGTVEEEVLDESTPIIQPGVYGSSKYLGAQLVRDSDAKYRSIEIRLPGIVGYRSSKNWLSSCVQNGLSGDPIRVFNPDTLFNNLIHVHDLVVFIRDIIASEDWSGRKVVCLAASDPIQTIQVATLIAELTGGKSKVLVEKSTRSGYTISTLRAESDFGYMPRSVTQIITDFVEENL